MIVPAAVFCLIVLTLAGGLALLEAAVRLLPWGLAVLAWTLEIAWWLASGLVGVWRALRRRGAPRGGLRAAA